MLLTDLRELKSVLEIDPNDTQEDKNLNFYVQQASNLIEELLNRPGLSYASRTEYYNGTGTRQLLLRSRPAYVTPTIQCAIDQSGYFGQTSGAFTASGSVLTYGVDFVLDAKDGVKSRSAMLIKVGGFWPKQWARTTGLLSPFLVTSFGCVKVTYSAGYTVDDLPAAFRLACNTLVANIRNQFPLGAALNSESYEERSLGYIAERKDYLFGLIKPLLWNYRNFSF